jgi:signal transduction histidine kinase
MRSKSTVRKTSFFILGLILSSLLIQFISAYSTSLYNPRQGMNDLINIVVDFTEPFLQAVLGGGNWTGYLLFEKLVIFILLAAVVYIALAKTKFLENNKPSLWIITIAIPLLGVRWLNFEWINFIITQYQVLAVALTALLPFVIFLFFVHGVSHSSAFRRIAWVFFILIYYGLWTTSSTTGYVDEAYLLTIFVAVALIIFDPMMHRLMTKEEDLTPLRASLTTRIAELDTQLEKINNAMHLSSDQQKKAREHLEKEIRRLQRELTRL